MSFSERRQSYINLANGIKNLLAVHIFTHATSSIVESFVERLDLTRLSRL